MRKLNLMLLHRAVSALERIADHVANPLLKVDEDCEPQVADASDPRRPSYGGPKAANTIMPKNYWMRLPGTQVEVFAENPHPAGLLWYRQASVVLDLQLSERLQRVHDELPDPKVASTLPKRIAALLDRHVGEYLVSHDQAVESLTMLFSRELAEVEGEAVQIERPALTSALREFVSKRFIGGVDVKEPIVQELLATVARSAPALAPMAAVRSALRLGSKTSDETTMSQLRSLMDLVDRLRERVEWPGRPENAYPWAVLEHVHVRLGALQEHYRRTDNGPSAAALVERRTGVVYLQTGDRIYRPVTAIDDDGRPVLGGARVTRDEIDAEGAS